MRYVALLRGINLAGKRRVPMARLRKVLERLGCAEVATLLQSGNAVFTSTERNEQKLIERLESSIAAEFGFQVSVLLRTRDELEAAIRKNPLRGAEKDPSRLVVTFLSGAPDPRRVRKIDAAAYLPDEFRVVGRELYARFPNGMGRSKLAATLSGPALGVIATARNWRTVAKLLDLAERWNTGAAGAL